MLIQLEALTETENLKTFHLSSFLFGNFHFFLFFFFTDYRVVQPSELESESVRQTEILSGWSHVTKGDELSKIVQCPYHTD